MGKWIVGMRRRYACGWLGCRSRMLPLLVGMGAVGCGTGAYDEQIRSRMSAVQAKFDAETVRVPIAGSRPADLVFQAPFAELADPAAGGATDPKLDWPLGLTLGKVPIQVRRGFVKAADNASYAYEWFYAAGELPAGTSIDTIGSEGLTHFGSLVPDGPGAWSSVQVDRRYWRSLTVKGSMPFRIQDGAQPSGTYDGTVEVRLIDIEGYFVLMGWKCIDSYVAQVEVVRTMEAALASAKIAPSASP